jgi:hypothetical protein
VTARAAFKQADLTRACKAAEAAGLKVARIVINDNGIEVIIGDPESAGRARNNPLDRLHAA